MVQLTPARNVPVDQLFTQNCFLSLETSAGEKFSVRCLNPVGKGSKALGSR